MRRSKNEKIKKKFKDKFDDYQLEWMKRPDISTGLSKLSTRQINNISSLLRRKMDSLYEDLKIEEKYIYHANLFHLYETLYRYFNIHTFLYKKTQKNYSPEEREKSIEDDLKHSPEKVFGYEVAFSEKLTIKINDALHWFSVFLRKYTLLYVLPLRDHENTAPKLCDTFIKRINSMKDNFEFNGEEELRKEAELINGVLVQVEYARNNLNLLTSGYSETDKKITKIAKSSLTKIEKIMNILKNDLLDEEIEK